jgi:hypothetical protein
MASSAPESTRAASTTQADAGANGMAHGQIVSHAAGRMRVRLQQQHRDPAALEAIEDRLSEHAAIDSITTNQRTGSVLVHYDHQRLTKDDLVELLWDAGLVARELLGAADIPGDLGRAVSTSPSSAPHSATATSLLDALTDLDRRLSKLTNGKLDVKLLVPTGLGLLAIRQIAMNGLGLSQVPGYVLLWYTFDSFYKLHQRKSAAVVERASEPGPEQRDAASDTR